MVLLRLFLIPLLILREAGADFEFDLGDALDVLPPTEPQKPRGRGNDFTPTNVPAPGEKSCPKRARDIVFLIDGSTGFRASEFVSMKIFLALFMKRFPDTNTQFALMQFSDKVQVHFDFAQFGRSRDPDSLIRTVHQIRGPTYTASGIQKAVKELFLPTKGARVDATRMLVVVMHGQDSGDPVRFSAAIAEAENAGVQRFVIGVGPGAQLQDLRTIASRPTDDHILQVDRFSITRILKNQLQEKLCASHGASHGLALQLPTTQPDACPAQSESQLLQKLDQVLSRFGQISTKMDALEEKCSRRHH